MVNHSGEYDNVILLIMDYLNLHHINKFTPHNIFTSNFFFSKFSTNLTLWTIFITALSLITFCLLFRELSHILYHFIPQSICNSLQNRARLYKDRFIGSVHPMIAATAYVTSGKIDQYFEKKKLQTNAFYICTIEKKMENANCNA